MTTFVQPDPPPAPRTDIVRRQDIIDQFGRIVDVYQDQQRNILGTVQTGSANQLFSSAGQVAERRKTSRMYLIFYGAVSGAAMAGLMIFAWRNGWSDGPGSFAFWLVGTALVTGVLAWRRHGQELELVPEAILRHIVDWYGWIAEYEAHSRRKAMRWEFEAEERRAEAAANDNAHARQMAQLRIAEMESRQRMQADRTTLDTPVAPAAQMAASAPPAVPPAPPDGNSTDDSAPTWQAVLLAFFAALYDRDSAGWINITDKGVITTQVPWSARAPLPAADKQRMLEIVRSRPAVVEQGDGGRWRLRVELFSTAAGTVDLLSDRCRRLSG